MRQWLLGGAILLSACGATPENDVSPLAHIPIAEAPIKRCMNLGSALEAPQEGEWGYVIRRDDLVRLKDAGFDTVRLPVPLRVFCAIYLRVPNPIQPIDDMSSDVWQILVMTLSVGISQARRRHWNPLAGALLSHVARPRN